MCQEGGSVQDAEEDTDPERRNVLVRGMLNLTDRPGSWVDLGTLGHLRVGAHYRVARNTLNKRNHREGTSSFKQERG